MYWFFLTLVSPFSHAIVNFLDKYLINRYASGDDSPSVGSLILFSSLFAAVILPIFLFFGIPQLPIELAEVIVLISVGIIYLGYIILYLYALVDEDASNIVPFWLTVPIFDFVLAWIYLNEQLSPIQIISALIIVSGGLILSLTRDEEGKIKVRWKSALLMVGSSALFSVTGLLFKKIAISSSFWNSLFFTYSGYLLGGMILFIFIRTYRQGFTKLLKKSGAVLLGVNVTGELLMICGDIAVRFATLLAPLALVETVSNAFQPLVVFLGGIFLTVLFPGFITESIKKKELVQKSLAIILMIIGAVILMSVTG